MAKIALKAAMDHEKMRNAGMGMMKEKGMGKDMMKNPKKMEKSEPKMNRMKDM